MNNPFESIDNAFDPFFNDTVQIVTESEKGKKAKAYKCCFFPVESIDAFVDNDIETTIKRVCLLIRKCDMCKSDKIRVGDMIITYDDEKYKISDITQNQQNNIVIYARSVK